MRSRGDGRHVDVRGDTRVLRLAPRDRMRAFPAALPRATFVAPQGRQLSLTSLILAKVLGGRHIAFV